MTDYSEGQETLGRFPKCRLHRYLGWSLLQELGMLGGSPEQLGIQWHCSLWLWWTLHSSAHDTAFNGCRWLPVGTSVLKNSLSKTLFYGEKPEGWLPAPETGLGLSSPGVLPYIRVFDSKVIKAKTTDASICTLDSGSCRSMHTPSKPTSLQSCLSLWFKSVIVTSQAAFLIERILGTNEGCRTE